MQSLTEEQPDHTSGNVLSKTFDFAYDASGKLDAASDTQTGLTRNFVFNDLGRLLQSIEPNGLSVTQEYDTHNRLSAHTDKRLNTTEYHRDDFGQVHYLVSQDTGITQYDYDAAGNRIQKRNANGDTTSYRWDAANRLVEQQDDDDLAIYLYDNINGQLIEARNAHTTEKYTYTPLAQLKTHTRQIDGHAFTTEYVYENNGKLRNKILPGGQSLRYHYYESGANAGTLRAITEESLFGLGQSTLLGEIDLDGRDGQTSYLTHNERRNEIEYHADGKAASMSVTDTLKLEYEYDEYGKIVGISQDGQAQRFGYSTGQLSEASTISGTYNYQYDVSGNRTAVSAQATNDDHESTLDYSAVATGNRLESRIDEQSGEEIAYRYNAAGSPIAIGDLNYTYNADQRPIEITRDGDIVAQYSYNTFGERIKKVTYSQNQKKVTYYLYDNRTLVAEIDGDTLEQRQTVYLKHIPVVHLIGNDVFAVHTDNLGTPKLLTSSEGETVWEATYTPLGEALISQQAIEFNLRFPGQYADAETGTHYNYQRDYDPRTGRYLTSDPIGLAGGDNTYAYANNNVLGAIDALGLFTTITGFLEEEALPFSPIGPGSDSSTVDTTASLVTHPTTLTDDITDLGVNDPNQLVNNFLTRGSLCDTEAELEYFAEQIETIIGGENYHSFLNAGYLLVGNEINHVIENPGSYENRETENAIVQLERFAAIDNSSILLIPECSDRQYVEEIVIGALGTLVHKSEIDAIIASMEAGDGCSNQASIVDVTDLHAEVLRRFQVKLETDHRVVDAEKALILAQAALDDFNSLHSNLRCRNTGRAVCQTQYQLRRAVEDAAEELARVLSAVYDEQVDNDMLPPYDTDAAKAEIREKIILGVIGVFIPLTVEDAAIEAGVLAATARFGKIGRLFEGASELVSTIRGANRAQIDDLIAEGTQAAGRANDINVLEEFGEFPDLHGLDFETLVRIEDRLDKNGLAKLNDDIRDIPGLEAAIDEDPTLVDTWKFIDELALTGTCSFDGSVEVQARGGMVPIQALRADLDYVLAKDELTGEVDYKLVTDVYSNEYKKQVLITTVNDATGEIQTITSNEIHPIFAQPKIYFDAVSSEGHSYKGDIEGGQWIDAVNLSSGDKLLNADSSNSTVISVEIVDIAFQAFNLSVDDFYTYYVSAPGGSTAYWVHNQCNAEIIARLKDPEKVKLLDVDLLESPELQAAFEANPDLAKQWEKLSGPSNADAIVRQDLNTLNMMDELASDIPIVDSGDAASRVAATGVDGTEFRSSTTFTNIGPNMRGPTVRPNGPLGALGIDKDDVAGTFTIGNPDEYMDFVRQQYVDADMTLHQDTADIIENYIRNPPNDEFLISRGYPGLHAEVQAMNDIYNQAGGRANVSSVNISTVFTDTGDAFGACPNCASIINGIEENYIITGVAPPRAR